jgi:hypothetical protein
MNNKTIKKVQKKKRQLTLIRKLLITCLHSCCGLNKLIRLGRHKKDFGEGTKRGKLGGVNHNEMRIWVKTMYCRKACITGMSSRHKETKGGGNFKKIQ